MIETDIKKILEGDVMLRKEYLAEYIRAKLRKLGEEIKERSIFHYNDIKGPNEEVVSKISRYVIAPRELDAAVERMCSVERDSDKTRPTGKGGEFETFGKNEPTSEAGKENHD